MAATTARDVGFGMIVCGVLGMWIGGANLVGRRYAARRWGRLGGPREIWYRKGMFFAPDWLSLSILVAGFVALVAGLVVQAVAGLPP